jgi:hypothetical protein
VVNQIGRDGGLVRVWGMSGVCVWRGGGRGSSHLSQDWSQSLPRICKAPARARVAGGPPPLAGHIDWLIASPFPLSREYPPRRSFLPVLSPALTPVLRACMAPLSDWQLGGCPRTALVWRTQIRAHRHHSHRSPQHRRYQRRMHLRHHPRTRTACLRSQASLLWSWQLSPEPIGCREVPCVFSRPPAVP